MPNRSNRPNQKPPSHSGQDRRGNPQHQRVGRRDPCPEGTSEGNMRAISAPYNFVPLADWVHIPDWSRQVSHDLPFRDGFGGEIAYTLVAESPLLVGGKQQKPADNNPGVVRPFQLSDDKYAIPGSSIKGMLRAVVEIAGFGRMRMVDDQRPGLRDISGKFVSESYINRIRGKVRTGFLRQQADGEQVIVPCKMARLDHRNLEAYFGIQAPIFLTRQSVREKFQRWSELCKTKEISPSHLSFDLEGYDAKCSDSGRYRGTPVFTGQISDSTKRYGKRRDFVFYDPEPRQTIVVRDDSWRDFLHIHGNDEQGKRAEGMSWPGHWKAIHRQGQDVPVFYVEDGGLLRLGLAYMLKLAGDFSIHDMVEHSSRKHLDPPGREHGYDLADLLFGSINGNQQGDALRGRVSCEMAVADGSPKAVQQPDTILNGPKPTYFPNYITQPSNPATWTLRAEQYATYIETQRSRQPTLRGFKRYPARPDDMTSVQRLTGEQETNRKVQVSLHTLPASTAFSGRIVFHNLKREELGALLWTLTFDGNSALRHGLGMGKPFGFGQVRIELNHKDCRLSPNDPSRACGALAEAEVDEFLRVFESHMEEACRQNWRGSPQIANLLVLADPQAASIVSGKGIELRHMRLMRCERDGRRENLNEFQWTKQKPPGPFVLADYATATGRFATGGGNAERGTKLPKSTGAAGTNSAQGTKGGTAYQHPAPQYSESVWTDAVLLYDPSRQAIHARFGTQSTAALKLPSASILIAELGPRFAQLKKKKELKGVSVTVRRLGNLIELLNLAPSPQGDG